MMEVTRDDAKKLALHVLKVGFDTGAFHDKRSLEDETNRRIGETLFSLYLENKDEASCEFLRLTCSSRNDPSDLAVVAATCAAFVANGAALPKVLREWFVQFTLQKIEIPLHGAGKAGAPEKRTPQAAAFIYAAVQALVDVKHAKATRQSYNPPDSACDIVAEALAEVGFPIKNFEDVKKIYTKVKRQTPEWLKKDPIWTPKPVQRWREGRSLFSDELDKPYWL